MQVRQAMPANNRPLDRHEQRSKAGSRASRLAWVSTLDTTIGKLENAEIVRSIGPALEGLRRIRQAQRRLREIVRRVEAEVVAIGRETIARVVGRWWRAKRAAPRRSRDALKVNNKAGKRRHAKSKSLNKAALARVAAAERRVAAAEKRAAELREELTGGGWCGAAARPGWMENDAKIQARLRRARVEARPSADAESCAEQEAAGAVVPRDSALSIVMKAEARIEAWLARGDSRAEVEEVKRAVELARSAACAAPKHDTPDQPTLAEARAMLRSAVTRLLDGEASAEVEVERLDQLVRAHPEYAIEMAAAAKQWDEQQAEANAAALATVRSAVPPDVFSANWSASRLEAAGLPPPLAKRVASKRALWLVRAPAERVAKTHVVELRGNYDCSGLDIVEARAVYAALPTSWENDPNGDKAAWAQALRDKLVELVKRDPGHLKPSERRHPAWAGSAARYFDPNQAPPPATVAAPSGLDNAPAARAAELEQLRASRKQIRLNFSNSTTPSKRNAKQPAIVVHLNSRRKPPRSHRRPPKPATWNVNFGHGAHHLAGLNLLEQLKAKLKDRNASVPSES